MKYIYIHITGIERKLIVFRKSILIVLCFALIITTVYASNIKIMWEVPFGEGLNKIKFVDGLEWFDFEVYNGRLFLSDIARNKISIFDSTGKYIKSIYLQATPEIIKLRNSIIIVLVQNGTLVVYDILKERLNTIVLGIDIESYAYSGAFFRIHYYSFLNQKDL